MAKITSGRGEGEIIRSFVFSETRVFNTRYIPQGVNSGTGVAVPNTRRNVFCGRNSAGVCFGKGYQEGSEVTPGFIIKTDQIDIQNVYRIAINGIFGIKKLVFNSNDIGTIVVTNYSSI